jgi:LPXTG-site transpeptidase (sortase) family protein
MPLYSYKKAPVKLKPEEKKQEKLESISYKKNKTTLGDVVIGAYNDFHNLMSTSKIAAMIVPALLVITGVSIIYRQVFPTFVDRYLQHIEFYEDNTTALVEGDFVQLDQTFSNPGSKYFAELKQEAQKENLLFQDEKSSNYEGTFTITIPSLDLYDLKTTANVDSSVEEIYDNYLTDGLAHFQGTSLPLSDFNSQNIVVYGHSAAGDYYQRTKDPAAAFTLLNKLRYGSEIYVNFEGKEYKYKFIKGKTVDKDDLSILQGQKGQKLLTLFTCFPAGNREGRYIATARLVEE